MNTHFKQYFSASTRQRGQEYFEMRSVCLEEHDNQNITACVYGTDEYTVKLKISANYRTPSRLQCFCSCPYFTARDFCKHIWATIVYIDSNILAQDFVDSIDNLSQGTGIGLSPWTEADAQEDPESKFMQSLGWRDQLSDALEEDLSPPTDEDVEIPDQRVWYAINFSGAHLTNRLDISLFSQKIRKDGTWGALKAFEIPFHTFDVYDQYDEDADFLFWLQEHQISNHHSTSQKQMYGSASRACYSLEIDSIHTMKFLKDLCRTGRVTWHVPAYNNEVPTDNNYFEDKNLSWGGESALKLKLALEEKPHSTGKKAAYLLKGFLENQYEAIPFENIDLPITPRFAIYNNTIKIVDLNDCYPWVKALRSSGNQILIPAKDVAEFVSQLYLSSHAPAIAMPEELNWPEITLKFVPKIILIQDSKLPEKNLYGKIKWCYGDKEFSYATMGHSDIIDAAAKKRIVRNRREEAKALRFLVAQGFRLSSLPGIDYELPKKNLVAATEGLSKEGWAVFLGRKKVVPQVTFEGIISSGIDWFELKGLFSVEGASSKLPDILTSIKKENDFLTLSNGNVFVLPDQLKRKLGAIARFGKNANGVMRFSRSQAILLDLLLEEKNNSAMRIDADSGFKKLSNNISKLSGVTPLTEDPKFQGVLREYQKEGLGWLYFLHQYGFGGCLADEMGLGKTVQVLALFSLLKHKKRRRNPSLIIVPRSLVYNWQREIEKYTALKHLDYSTSDRSKSRDCFADYDLIITTYAILRKDIAFLKDIDFCYVVLDEAQAIKNSLSQSAKASRLLHADHRLCLTGTPIENQIDDLWSLFEFLNPGFLEGAAIKGFLKAANHNSHQKSLAMITKAIQPFILRRTKEKVAKDLPDKSEQTLFCELPANQRKEYNKLKDFYRLSLSKKAQEMGFQKTKVHVLEALLRLRQVACHPGLIDEKLANTESAKIALLLDHLEEIIASGRKVLIFSQFTKMLALVKNALEKHHYSFEYLDGQTKNRQKKVDRFQNEALCQIFLISLKAGGVGLNLTQAEYCFILDPWWNPASEAQAIDRAHRIGQENHVFAYRIIAKNTVEEKILALQNQKRQLFDSVVAANNSFMKNLSSQDLELLLS